MKSFLLHKQYIQASNVSDTEKYTSWVITGDTEKELNKIKTSQEDIYKAENIKYIYDAFHIEKSRIAEKYNAGIVTNAWLKIFEICNVFNLINENKVIHFDNAAYPGAFILAINHYCKTHNIEYEWRASSMIDNTKDNVLLQDKFKLHQNYKTHWLMNEEHNGDVTNLKNLNFWKETFRHKVTLYTSDLGFETGADNKYENQELSHIKPHLGQILAGLYTLAKGGHMVVKQYTFFEMLNVSILSILTNLFEEVHICKPVTSRCTNSETYIVAKGFRGPFVHTSNEYHLIQILEKKLEHFNEKPLIGEAMFEQKFLCSLQKAYSIHEAQISALKHRYKWYKSLRFIKKQNRVKIGLYKLKKLHQHKIDEFHKNVSLKGIDKNFRLAVNTDK